MPGLRLHFVDVGVRPAGLRARAAQATPPPYVTRAQWGAAGCPPRSSPDYGEVRSVHVHHTVSLNDYTPAEAPGIVLAICRYHRNSNGWNDIGYNALVDKYGTLYEGRAGGLDQAVVGAQAQGFNSVTAGISNIGDHTSLPQTPEALAAMASYIRWKLTIHGQPLGGRVTVTSAGGSASRYGAGARVTLERVIGHRDTGRTACPGAALYAQLPELRALVETGAVAPFQSFATRLTAGLTDDSIDFGQPAPVSGALVDPSGLPLAGERLDLQVASDGSWRTARRVTTGPDGVFFTELKPARRMYVRVRYPGRAPPAARAVGAAAPAPAAGDPRVGGAAPRRPRRAAHDRGQRRSAQARAAARRATAAARPLAQGPCGERARAQRALRDLLHARPLGPLPLLPGCAVRPRHRPRRHRALPAARHQPCLSSSL